MHKNQQVECSRLQRRLDDLKRKKVTIKSDWSELTKNPVKLVFSLKHEGNEWMNSNTYLGWMRLVPFIESLEWVYLLGATNIVGDVWTQQGEWSEFGGIHLTFRDEGQWSNHLKLQKHYKKREKNVAIDDLQPCF